MLVLQKNKWNATMGSSVSYTLNDPVFNTVYIISGHARTQIPLWKSLVLDVGGFRHTYKTNSKHTHDFFEFFNTRSTAQIESHTAGALLLRRTFENSLKEEEYRMKSYLGGVVLSYFSTSDKTPNGLLETAKYNKFSRKFFEEVEIGREVIDQSTQYYDPYLYFQYMYYFGRKSIMVELNLISPHDFFKQGNLYKKGVRVKTKYSFQPMTFLLDVYAPMRKNNYTTLVVNPKMFGVKTEVSVAWLPKEKRGSRNGIHVNFAVGFKQFYHTANVFYDNPFSGIDGIANVFYVKLGLTALQF